MAEKVAESQLPAEEFLAELRKSMKTESEDHSGYIYNFYNIYIIYNFYQKKIQKFSLFKEFS
ncbi:hypothetical protein C7Y71_003855 [Pseudoprevotella muciniphila]|uniref:Uncharacterized protein n=1 Tax=Pseudoprevotella muciniphila TaxID=2133944 RepID=A0A5P8E5D8_9BACT|nr:hypothetical protein C7Y71_003855 [Pseudoprevotella muciniphila]